MLNTINNGLIGDDGELEPIWPRPSYANELQAIEQERQQTKVVLQHIDEAGEPLASRPGNLALSLGAAALAEARHPDGRHLDLN